MTSFIAGVIILGVAVLLILARKKVGNSGVVVNGKPAKKSGLLMLIGGIGAAVVGIIMVISSVFVSVDTGHTGVVTTFGRVENYTFDSGVHVKAPWNSVVEMEAVVPSDNWTFDSFG